MTVRTIQYSTALFCVVTVLKCIGTVCVLQLLDGRPLSIASRSTAGCGRDGEPHTQSLEALISATQELDAMIAGQLPQLVPELLCLHRVLRAMGKE